MAVRNRAHRPDAERCHRCGHEAHEGRTQTIRRPAHAGSRLKLRDVLGRLRLKGQPSSRTGENSPYGMIGGIEETSASFEARSAPRSYPTDSDIRPGVELYASKPQLFCLAAYSITSSAMARK